MAIPPRSITRNARSASPRTSRPSNMRLTLRPHSQSRQCRSQCTTRAVMRAPCAQLSAFPATVFRVYDFGAMGARVRLLDATIRDGSYCVDFQFTAADTAIVIALLDAAGVGFIELGHGSGTFHHKAPANIRSATRQAATDEAYFAAARAAAPHAKIGVITGTFGKDELHTLVEHRIDFVRMAVMADKALDPANLAMAERAKSLGLTFSVNLMQTVAITP